MSPDLNQNIKHFPPTSLLFPPQAKQNYFYKLFYQTHLHNRTTGDFMALPDPVSPRYATTHTFRDGS